MHFEPTKKVTQLKEQLNSFMEKHIIPADVEFQQIAETGTYPIELINRLKVLARKEGLWNLFLPGLKNNKPGTRLSNVEYAPLAEIMGRYPWASEVFNCSAPDTGNMELLHLFATPEQEQTWLKPLLDGSIRSAVSITEPDVASSDPTNLQTTIERNGTISSSMGKNGSRRVHSTPISNSLWFWVFQIKTKILHATSDIVSSLFQPKQRD